MLESVKHIAKGKEYEIRPISTATGFRICTYFQGKQIGWTYSATYEVAREFDQAVEPRAVDELIKIAKSDLDRGTTE
jgi:hypothetical protein